MTEHNGAICSRQMLSKSFQLSPQISSNLTCSELYFFVSQMLIRLNVTDECCLMNGTACHDHDHDHNHGDNKASLAEGLYLCQLYQQCSMPDTWELLTEAKVNISEKAMNFITNLCIRTCTHNIIIGSLWLWFFDDIADQLMLSVGSGCDSSTEKEFHIWTTLQVHLCPYDCFGDICIIL